MKFPRVFLYIQLIILTTSFTLPASGSSHSPPGQTRSVTGKVVDSSDGQQVPYINIIVEDTSQGTITDSEGRFSLQDLPGGISRIIVQGMGYETRIIELDFDQYKTDELVIEIEYTGINIDEIVVTSSPTGSGFRYTSDMSIMGEELARRSEVSFGELLDGEPGVAMRSMGSAPARPVIRGMDGDRVLVLENGERMGDVSESGAGHSLAMDPVSTSRLEVVKGPASLLYGPSALGGVINIFTNDIPERWDMGSSGVVSLQGGTMNNMGSGLARYTYGTENWAAGGRIAYRSAGNIRTPEGIMPGTYIDHFDAATGFGIERENVTGGISLSANMQTYGLPEELDDPNEKVENRQQRYGLQGRFGFERDGFFDKAQLRFHGTYLSQKEVEIETEDGFTEEEVELSHDKHLFSTTLTMQHKPAGIFDRGAVGLNIHGHNLEIGGEDAYTPGEKRYNLGVFTFQEIPLASKLRLQAGLRVDANHISALPNHIFPDVEASRNAFNFTGSVGLNYRPAESVEIGGQFARSHRNPVVEELFADGPHLCSGTYELGDPDITDEIGYGADMFISWKNDIFRIELAGFTNYFENFIIFEPVGGTDPDSGLPFFQYMEDKARFYGGEVSMKLQPNERFTAGVGMDYVNARRMTGDRDYLPFIPPFRVRTNLEYDYGRGWVGAEARTTAAQERVAAMEDTTDGYTILGLSAGYRFNSSGRHIVILRVDNLMDTKYRDHLSRVEDRHYSMPGRDFRLSYRWVF